MSLFWDAAVSRSPPTWAPAWLIEPPQQNNMHMCQHTIAGLVIFATFWVPSEPRTSPKTTESWRRMHRGSETYDHPKKNYFQVLFFHQWQHLEDSTRTPADSVVQFVGHPSRRGNIWDRACTTKPWHDDVVEHTFTLSEGGSCQVLCHPPSQDQVSFIKVYTSINTSSVLQQNFTKGKPSKGNTAADIDGVLHWRI